MTSMKHTLGVIGAGVLAFGLVFSAHQLTMSVSNTSASSDSGGGESVATHPLVPLDEAIIGRWKAPLPANQDAFVEFASAGIWHGSDGCNGASGTWSVKDDSSFRGGGNSAMTLIGCDNVGIPEAVWSTTHAEITESDELILINEAGDETLLVRESSDAFELVGSWAGPGSTTSLSVITFDADGQWSGSLGCSEYKGTWELGPSDMQDFETPTSEEALALAPAGPGTLRIGPAPADGRSFCLDDSAPSQFVLDYDTNYWFWIGPNNTFSVYVTGAGMDSSPSLKFMRVESPTTL